MIEHFNINNDYSGFVVKPFVTGRKNQLFSNTAKSGAKLYVIIEQN